ncbi:MAG: XdhC family protein [Chloroflexi bacterium]|nr:XdhC family protein [Chloroflexota bacterium]
MTAISPYLELAALLRRGCPASLATVVSSSDPHLLPGTALLFTGEDSSLSIHPELDALLAADTQRLLAEERSEVLAYHTPSGDVEIFVESFLPPQQLIIVGAVHVAIALSKIAKLLGYKVTLVDPRGVFATAERFPEADRIIVDWPEDAFQQIEINMSTSIAVLTHDPKLDLPALLLALNSEARYVGMIGSRSTAAQRKAGLAAMGATKAQLSRIHSPVGLNIGARTPAEIALSAMAEIVAVRRRGASSPS